MSELTFQVARITAENYRFRPPRRVVGVDEDRVDACFAGVFLATAFVLAGFFLAAAFVVADVFLAAAFFTVARSAAFFFTACGRTTAFLAGGAAPGALPATDFLADCLVTGAFSVVSGIATTPGTARSTLRRDAEYPVMTNAA